MIRSSRLLALLAVVLVALPVAAQDTRAPLLFVLEDADSRVTLLGSIHVLPQSAYPLPASIDAAYAEAEQVAVETDIGDTDALYAAVQARSFYTDGRTLPDVIGKAGFGKLTALMHRLGVPAEVAFILKPWAAEALLTSLAAQSGGFRADLGVDMHLIERARADGKPLRSLETAHEQIAMFDAAPDSVQAASLMDVVRAWGTPDADGEALLSDLVSAWERGDEAALEAYAEDLPDAVLGVRNARWVPQIEDMLALDGQDVLVVVGAAHLVGDDSVVAMLRARGHTVTRSEP